MTAPAFGITDADIAAADAAASSASAASQGAGYRVNAITNTARTTFQNSPEYVKAKADDAAAQLAVTKTRAKAIATTQASDAYQSAKAASDAAQKTEDSLRDNGGNDTDIMNAVTAVMQSHSVLYKMEKDALTSDLSYQNALVAAATADAAVKQLQDQFRLKLLADPEYQKAKADADQASTNAIAAADADQSLRDAKQAQDNQYAAEQRRR